MPSWTNAPIELNPTNFPYWTIVRFGEKSLSSNVQYLFKKKLLEIENIIPNFSNLIESSHVLSPEDIENEFGLKEGNLNHGEMTLDQFMFMRPTISSSQYTTPIKNLYICGGGTHPGGGLHGGNGYNAAKTILNKW